MTGSTRGSDVRARIGHPVVDGDGHLIEFWPRLREFLIAEGIDPDQEALTRGYHTAGHLTMSLDERAERREVRAAWWGLPTKNTFDHATATMPRLLYERMPSIGIDFATMFPTMGLAFGHIRDDGIRQATCRAYNEYVADLFAPYRDRLEPVAVVPLSSPEEGLAELEHVKALSLKTIVIPNYIQRQVEVARPAVAAFPELAKYTLWMDFYGLDSAYDYDPFWARCVELGLSVSAHSPGFGWGSRASITNFMNNHLGHFGVAGEALCRWLFMGGVTRRFPGLRIAFMEGGTAWAAQLLVDFVGHWEKRNGSVIDLYNPVHFDSKAFLELLDEYGDDLRKADRSSYRGSGLSEVPPMDGLDEFAALRVERIDQLVESFVSSFYFGCEADDPMVSTAFNTRSNPLGVRLNAVFGSDIGHWDVPDIDGVLEEAYEGVEHGWLSREDFRAFAFENPVRFHTDANPSFFAGTSVADDVAALLASRR